MHELNERVTKLRGEMDKQKGDLDSKINALEEKVDLHKSEQDRKRSDLITRVDQLGSNLNHQIVQMKASTKKLIDELQANTTIEVTDDWKEQVGYKDNFRDVLLQRRSSANKFIHGRAGNSRAGSLEESRANSVDSGSEQKPDLILEEMVSSSSSNEGGGLKVNENQTKKQRLTVPNLTDQVRNSIIQNIKVKRVSHITLKDYAKYQLV